MFFNFGHSSNCGCGSSTFLGGGNSANCGCGGNSSPFGNGGIGNGNMLTQGAYFGGGFAPSRCCGITGAYIPGPAGPVGPQGPMGPIGPQGAQGPQGPQGTTEQVL